MLNDLLGILKIIGILGVFIFMLFAHRENNRTFKVEMNKLREKGKLPSKKILFLRALIAIICMFPIPIVLTIIVINVRKLDFSASIFFPIMVLFFLCEIIIGSVISIIQSFAIDCKKKEKERR